MAFDTAEKRRSAIHLTKRGALPVAKGLIDQASRLHFIGIFSTLMILPQTNVFWTNRGNVRGSWGSKKVVAGQWTNKKTLSTQWREKVVPPDSATRIED